MKRSRALNSLALRRGTVVYWMSRDQRAQDNWALLEAQALALETQSPLRVVFCLASTFGEAPQRAYRFMLNGLRETFKVLLGLGIPFTLLPDRMHLPAFLDKVEAGALVCDFSPLREPVAWKKELLQAIGIAAFEVDAHNVVPAWLASPKAEIGARTLRPKIARMLSQALIEFPPLEKHPFPAPSVALPEITFEEALRLVRARQTPVDSLPFSPGTAAGSALIQNFIERLSSYSTGRNNPTLDAQSGLSPWLHFGQISAQRVALQVLNSGYDEESRAPFLEELIVRKELADNFCLYRPDYDKVSVFPGWASASLKDHLSDPRPYIYDREALENADTHDLLWNAAQTEMTVTGKMHGWLRMYWGKKILEWSKTPQEALDKAIFLNNRYSLDGRDPNGYAGIAWCIGAIHDRAWPSRLIYGKVRSMTESGAKRKFDVKKYIGRVLALTQN